MPVRLWACLTGSCPVLYFRNEDGCCRLCRERGRPVVWALKGGR